MTRQLDIFDLPIPDKVEAFPFKGSDYDPKYDLKRLTGQLKDIYNLMKDGKFRTLREIESITGHPQASISAQLRNLRNRFKMTLNKQPRGDRESGLFEYRVIENELS